MPNPNTDDTPLQLAIEPDWSLGIELGVEFSSSVQRSWAGRDQRQRKREKPLITMRYEKKGLTPTEAKARILGIRDESRQPIMGPLWPDGIAIQTTMTGVGATNVQLNENPVHEWSDITVVWIWNRALGGEFRSVASVVTRTVTLSGTGTAYPTGAFIFPCRLMLRVVTEEAVQPINLSTGTETVEFKTI